MRATPWYPFAPCHVPVRVRLNASQEKRKEKAAQVLFYACSMLRTSHFTTVRKAEGYQPGGHPYAPHIENEKRRHTTLARPKNEPWPRVRPGTGGMGSYGKRRELRMHRLPLLSTHMYYDLRHYFRTFVRTQNCHAASLRHLKKKFHTLARPVLKTEPWQKARHRCGCWSQARTLPT